jgi:hypothetical protein
VSARPQGPRIIGDAWCKPYGSIEVENSQGVPKDGAAVAELSTSCPETIAPQLRVPTEEAAAVGGNSDAAADDGADIVSCMFMHMET